MSREFAGTLREHQREGMGWQHYLGEARIGACLADDMGLGKTVQVLALLAEHASARGEDEPRTSLVVAPSSVVPSWLAEAARFAPNLRVLDFTGSERGEKREQIGGARARDCRRSRDRVRVTARRGARTACSGP